MKRLIKWFALFQFFPLAIFVGVAKAENFSNAGWEKAFQWGALAGAVELAVLLPILRNEISRLVAGATLFLITGGAAFYFKTKPLLDLMAALRESGLIFFAFVACLIATLVSKTGVFEDRRSRSGAERKYSVYFLVGAVAALGFSWTQRGNVGLAGVAPFMFMVFLKQLFQSRLKDL